MATSRPGWPVDISDEPGAKRMRSNLALQGATRAQTNIDQVLERATAQIGSAVSVQAGSIAQQHVLEDGAIVFLPPPR